MNGHVHLIGASVAGLGMYSLAPGVFSGHPAALLAAPVAGLMADIDHPGSTIHRTPLGWLFPGVQEEPGGRVASYRRPAWGQGGGHFVKVGISLPWGGVSWHREEFHSVFMAAVYAVIAAAAASELWGGGLWWPVLAAALAGSLSHLALDRFNRSKEYLGWPFIRGKRGHVQDWWPRIRVGSPGEWLVGLGLTAVMVSQLPGFLVLVAGAVARAAGRFG